MEDKSTIALKSIYIIAFISFLLILLVAWNSPASGYESSIYKSTPYLWIALAFIIVTGIVTLNYQIYSNTYDRQISSIGLLVIFQGYIICLSFFIIRGYFMWAIRGDPATHIGTINLILDYHHISSNLFYPILHIFCVMIMELSNLNIIFLHKILPLFMGSLQVIFIYLIAKTVCSKRISIILTCILSINFIYGWYLNLTPNHIGNFLFPLVLLILVKSCTTGIWNWKFLLIVVIFLYPPLHMVPSIIILIVIIIFALMFLIFNKSKAMAEPIGTNVNTKINLSLITLLGIWIITWISSFGIWSATIRNIATILQEGGATQYQAITEQATYASGHGINVLDVILKIEFGSIIYVFLALVSLPILFRKNFKSNNSLTLATLTIASLFILFLAFISLFTNLGFGAGRLFYYSVTLCTFPAAYTINTLIDKIRNINSSSSRKIAFTLLNIFMIILFLNSVLILYPSPYIKASSSQTTSSEINGFRWYFENRNINLSVSGISIAPGRFLELLTNSLHRGKSKENIPYYLTEGFAPTLPFHFGYNDSSSMATKIDNDTYLIITDRDKSLFVETYPELADSMWSFNDFQLLASDVNILKLYNNGGAEISYVRSKQN